MLSVNWFNSLFTLNIEYLCCWTCNLKYQWFHHISSVHANYFEQNNFELHVDDYMTVENTGKCWQLIICMFCFLWRCNVISIRIIISMNSSIGSIQGPSYMLCTCELCRAESGAAFKYASFWFNMWLTWFEPTLGYKYFENGCIHKIAM